MASKHGIGERKAYSCSQCERVFYAAVLLRKHINAYHSGKVFNCDICNRTYQYEESLRAHLRNAHPPPGTIYPCICGETFDKYYSLEHHKRKYCRFKKSTSQIRKESSQISIECSPAANSFSRMIEVVVK